MTMPDLKGLSDSLTSKAQQSALDLKGATDALQQSAPTSSGDSFDFTRFTTEPTTGDTESRPVVDCEGTTWLTGQIFGGANDSDISGSIIDSSADLFPSDTYKPTESLLDL